MRIKIGIAGLGSVAQSAHIPALLGFDDVEISAACDVDKSVLKRIGSTYKIPSLYLDYVEMAEKSDVDCVFVLTNPETHFQITSYFLENGKAVFCEKPMAMKLSEATSMVKKAQKQGLILMVGFNRRFMPVYQHAKKIFNEKKHVDVCSVELNGSSFALRRRDLAVEGIHIVDLLRHFCGEPAIVESNINYDDPLLEKSVASIIKFDTGAVGIQISNHTGGGYLEKTEIYGANSTVLIDAGSQTVQILKCDHIGSKAPLIWSEFRLPKWSTNANRYGFEQEDRHFIDCVKTGKEPLTSGKDAIESHKLIHVIYTKSGLPGIE